MFDDIGKSGWPCLAALWAVSSVSCQFWQVGSDSSDRSVTQRIEVRYEADLLPERNDPPFAAESECGVQSINNGILNIEDNGCMFVEFTVVAVVHMIYTMGMT